MATISITIPDAALTRVLDAFAAAYQYDAASGQTKAQFAKAQVASYVKDVVRAHESSLAAEAARLTALENADAVVIG